MTEDDYVTVTTLTELRTAQRVLRFTLINDEKDREKYKQLYKILHELIESINEKVIIE